MITTTTTPPTPPPTIESTTSPMPTSNHTSSSSPQQPQLQPQQPQPQHRHHIIFSAPPQNPHHRHSTSDLNNVPSSLLSATATGTTTQPAAARKFSASLAALQTTAVGLLSTDVAGLLSARRRISNVSDAVSRKLSHTIGWKMPAVPSPEIIAQGRCLCGQYVRGRLRRAGVYNKKMGLQRMRSGFANGVTLAVVRDVYPALSCVSLEGL